MYAIVFFTTLVAAATAFTPTSRMVTKTSLAMELGDVAKGTVGSDIEYPEFDPWGLTQGISEEKYAWYKAAELKHGRVAMLAALGQLTQYFVRLGDPVFSEGNKPLKAVEQVISERPLAAVQIIGFIFACEALGQFQQVQPGREPGDLGFDPLSLKPDDPETWEKVQTRELKNGRLAMLAIAGMLYTEVLTGNGVLEAWAKGAISPFNDGIGIF